MVHGGPEVLHIIDVPPVSAGPGQVRIRIHAAAVNPDRYCCAKWYAS